MNKKNLNSIVAIYLNHKDAEEAIKLLQKSDYDMKKLSIIGRDYHPEEHVLGYYNIGDRMLSWGKFGAFWGGIWGLVFGSGLFFIPGIGAILIGGPVVGLLVSALETAAAAGTVSAFAAAFYSLGVPQNSILKYEKELKSDRFLLIAHGDAQEIQRAKEIIEKSKKQDIEIYEQLATSA